MLKVAGGPTHSTINQHEMCSELLQKIIKKKVRVPTNSEMLPILAV